MQRYAQSAKSPDGLVEQATAHRGAMLLAATRVLRDRAAAEDVVQDVLLELWLRPAAFDARRGSLSSYVTMLARSRAVDRWRTRAAREGAASRARGEVSGHAGFAPSAADVAARRDAGRELATALARLPAEQRDALLLAYGRDLSAEGVAAVKGIPLGTAKSRIRLGLSRTRTLLASVD